MKRLTLKAARVAAGFTQDVAAEKIGVGVSTIKNWEKGITFPAQPKIERICLVYGVDYDDLIFCQ